MIQYEAHVSRLDLWQALYDDKVYTRMTSFFVLILTTNIVTVGKSTNPSPVPNVPVSLTTHRHVCLSPRHRPTDVA